MTAHHFTVDVEEYFHPTALSRHYPMAGWDGLERRSPTVIGKLLDFLEERGIEGTFFVVGWLAEREREMVRSIVARGHEIASHGYEHELVGRLGPDGFRSSVRRSKSVIEEIVGEAVRGYRAPSFSIVPGLEWAFDVLIEEGYRYDASLFPVSRHPTYGFPSAPANPHWIERPSGKLAEFPATILDLMGARLPASGGAYFRLLPYALTGRALRQAASRGVPGMFYTHPWELDLWTPNVPAPWIQRFRTFAGRSRCWGRLDRMAGEFRFQSIGRSLTAMGVASGRAERVD